MSLLPFEEFYLDSTLMRDEVITLFASTAWKKQQLAGHRTQSSETDRTVRFDVEPVQKYRSSFLPIINGVAKTTDTGCCLKISTELPVATVVLLLAICTWLVVSMALMIGNTTAEYSYSFSPKVGVISGTGAVVFAVIGVLLFKVEARRNRLALTRRLAIAEGN